nr:flocculin [Haemonchus contortus]
MKRGKRACRGRRGGLDESFGGDGGLAFDKRNRAGRDRGGYHGSRGGGTDSRDCWRGSWRDVGRGNQQGWQGQKRSGGFSGFSTGSFGVMGDVDIINCSSNSPENVIAEIPIANMEDFSCGAVCEKVEKIGCNITHEGELPEFNKHEEIAFTSNPLQDKGASYEVFESSKHVEHHQSRTINVHKETVIRLRKNIEVNSSESAVCPREGSPIQAVVYPSEPDLEPALKHKNDAVPANINGLDDFIRHSTHPKRRVRSLSQTLMNGFGGGSLKEERRSSTKYYSIRATEEECRQFVGDEEGQIRSIHNDGNFNNHRLSKLSIHTNNDEFFYVGGHPPSDGRTSLRSRGTISRQSILRSSDFLPSTCDDELPEEAFEAALSSQSEEYRRMPDVPTILVNGKRLSGSSNVDSHYMTASEQIRSPEVGGEVLEAMISSRSELLSNEDKNTHSEASGTTTFVTPLSTYGSQEAFKQSHNSNESFCHQKMSDGVGNTYTPSREELQQLPTLQLTSSENNFNQDGQLTEMPYERSAEARIPRQFFATSRQIIDDQSPTVHTCSSQASIDRANCHHPQDMRKSKQNVADEIESPTAQKYSSEIMLHAAHNHHPFTASRQRLSMSNVADGDEPATAQLNSSEVSLHAGDSHPPLTASRQSVRLSTQNVADDVEPATAQIYSSQASLHAADSHPPLTASRQSMRMSTSNVAGDVELPTAQVYSSQASLHAAESHHPLTASRQSMRMSTSNVADDVEPATAQMYSSQASLHAAESHHPLTASRQSMERTSTQNVADDVELPTAQVYSSQASLHAAECHHPLTASRQSMSVLSPC